MEETNNLTEVFNSQAAFKNFNIVVFLLTLIVGLVALFGNIVIIGVIAKYPSLRNSDSSMHLIAFLAGADGLNGFGISVALVYQFYLFLFKPHFNRGSCLSSVATMIAGSLASQLMIGWVALDRVMAVTNPMAHKVKDHFKFALHCAIITVVYVLISVVLMFVGGDLQDVPKVCSAGGSFTKPYLIYWMLFSFSIATTVVLLYVVVVVVLKRKAKTTLGTSRSALAQQLKRQAQVIRVVGLILGIYLGSWVLSNVILTGSVVLGFSREVTGFLAPLVGLGTAISSASNVFIYSYKMPEFRSCLRKFFSWKNENVVGPSRPDHTSRPSVRTRAGNCMPSTVRTTKC